MASPEKEPHSLGWHCRVGIALLVIGVVYVSSYVALRCTVLKYLAKRSSHDGVTRIRTWCYYQDGDNWQTVWSNVIYTPLIRAEQVVFPPSVFE